MLFKTLSHVHFANGFTGSALRRLAGAIQTLFECLEVLELKLKVDRLFVAERIHASVDVGNVVVFEAAQDVQYRVALADVAQKLVA